MTRQVIGNDEYNPRQSQNVTGKTNKPWNLQYYLQCVINKGLIWYAKRTWRESKFPPVWVLTSDSNSSESSIQTLILVSTSRFLSPVAKIWAPSVGETYA